MSESYNILIRKIDDFIRKYYVNLLIKGGLLSVALLLSFFIVLAILEYFFNLSIIGRTIIFYAYIFIAATIFIAWILIPILKLMHLGKIISHEKAAEIIGKFFPEVDDQLLNTIQLVNQSNAENINLNILNACIEQRSIKFKKIQFKLAIPFSANRKYVRFLIPPVAIIIFIVFAAPNIITESTKRIINHSTFYEKPAPFEFIIENKNLSGIENQDFELKIKIVGNEVPDQVYLVVKNFKFKLKKEDINHFKYIFKTLSSNINFSLVGDEVQSKTYTLKVIPKPSIISFYIKADYPAYTSKSDEIFENIGDISVPAGTKLSWNFNTKDTRKLYFLSKDSLWKFATSNTNQFQFNRTLFKDFNYTIFTSNEFIQNPDSIKFLVQVIPDLFPQISVEEQKDSISDSRIYFKGIAKDDYGFSKLLFKYCDKSKSDKYNSILIVIPAKTQQAQFFHFFDLTTIGIQPGSKIEYYFEVYDNDNVTGPKSTKSQLFQFKAPSEEEIRQMNQQRSDEMQKSFSSSIKEAVKIQKEIEKLQLKLNDQKEISWQDKEKLKNLVDRFEKLQNELEEIKNENKLKSLKEEEYQKENERIAEKQKELQELLDKLLTPEMKATLEEMQKLLEKEMQKQDAMKMLEQLKLENKDIEKQLDRNLEIFKQMEFDSKLQNAIDKLDELQQKQEELSKKAEQKNSNSEDIKKEQDKLNDEFKKFEEMVKDADKANQELEKPNDFNKMEEEQKGIEEEMQKSSDQLEKGKSGGASKSQKSASQQMKSMSEKMKQMQESMEQESNEEDMEALRAILDNLIETSFNQENLIQKLAKISKTDPKYPSLIQEQKKIKEDLKMIEDSLLALSKRQASIEPFVNREISEINRNVESTLSALTEMNTIGPTNPNEKSMAMGKQQFVLTSVNNLALMLDEALKQMQQQQQQAKSGSGKKCSKPKSGQGAQSLRQMQEQMNKQLRDLQQKQGQGNPQMPGKGSKQGNSMSEEFSKMAAQQEALRRKVQEYQEKLKKEGRSGEAKEFNKIAEEMEKTETELVNRMISEESLKRQQDIVTRLLEAEKAERERDEKEERESTEAKDIYQRNFERFLEYNKQKTKELELLKTIPSELKPFYKKRVNNYFESIQSF